MTTVTDKVLQRLRSLLLRYIDITAQTCFTRLKSVRRWASLFAKFFWGFAARHSQSSANATLSQRTESWAYRDSINLENFWKLACTVGGAEILRVSRSTDGSLRVMTSSRLKPMRIATKLTIIGSPPPTWPYVFPKKDEPIPSNASVVASPNAKAEAL